MFILAGLVIFGAFISSIWMKYIIYKNPVGMAIEYEELVPTNELPPKYEDIN